MNISSDTTSTQLPFTAFTNYMVGVDAVYASPPNGNKVFVNLLPPTTFTTPERGKENTIIKVCIVWQSQ